VAMMDRDLIRQAARPQGNPHRTPGAQPVPWRATDLRRKPSRPYDLPRVSRYLCQSLVSAPPRSWRYCSGPVGGLVCECWFQFVLAPSGVACSRFVT
jgi:hypothetical protein